MLKNAKAIHDVKSSKVQACMTLLCVGIYTVTQLSKEKQYAIENYDNRTTAFGNPLKKMNRCAPQSEVDVIYEGSIKAL